MIAQAAYFWNAEVHYGNRVYYYSCVPVLFVLESVCFSFVSQNLLCREGNFCRDWEHIQLSGLDAVSVVGTLENVNRGWAPWTMELNCLLCG
jgi:hypothetical protein